MRTLALVLGLLFARGAAAQTDSALDDHTDAPDRKWTPWYLPRYAMAGFVSSINSGGTFSFSGRVGWEITLIDQKTNLVGLVELGPGFAMSEPPGIQGLYQHSVTAGVGLRPRRSEFLQWGVGVTFGAMLYGAHLTGRYDEQFLDGVLDARAQVGINLGPMALEAFFGVTQIWYVNSRKLSSPYVGGLNFGLMVDWR